MRSLKSTLGLTLVIGLIAIVGLQWWLVSVTFREITENYVVSRLQRDIDTLLGGITFTPQGMAQLQLEQQTYFDDRPFSGHYYRIEIGDRVLRSKTLWDQDIDVETAAVGEQRQQRLTGPLEQQLLTLTQGYRKQDRAISITVAEDISALLTQLHDFQIRYLLVSGGLLCLLLVLLYFLMRQSLAPLQGVQQDLPRLARGETRSVRDNVPQELLPLVREFNRLLQLLNQRVERSRHMVGNLAHALKTPLSVLQQTAQSRALDDQPELRARLLGQTNTIHQRLERELNRARLAGDSNTGIRFRPADDLPALISMLEQAHSERGIRIDLETPADTAGWPAEREDMLELAGNLLDNACKWARRQVRVSVQTDPDCRLLVEDDGPGCPPALREALGERGKRFDEQTAGHGLGLAICRDIVDHYQGDITFDESPLGGLRVTVTLPAQNSR